MTVPAPQVFNARVVEVHDGDTFGAVIDLGDGVYRGSWWRPWPIRLAGVNARELTEPGGLEARDNLRALLPPGTEMVLSRVQRDHYPGRWDATVETKDAVDLGLFLEMNGWVAHYPGSGPKQVPPWPRNMK